jgi:DNA-binding transcriptional LysR family regulator
MDLEHLKLFVAVVEAASFSGAARRLGLPKSTVSRGLGRLEADLDLRLVNRTTRRVALSSAGRALYERVAPLLSALTAAVGALPELAEQPSGRIRVTATVDFGATVLAELVTRFVALHPATEVELKLSNQVVDLVAEGIDLALRVSLGDRLRDSTLAARHLSRVSVRLYAAPGYLARRGAPRRPADLAGHDWIIYGSGPALKLRGPRRTVTLKPRGRIVCDDMWFTREAARAGGGIALMPTFFAEPDITTGQLARVLPSYSLQSGHIWLVWPSTHHLPRKVAAFRDFVVEALRSRSFAAE